ncbi:phosphatase PAP2 family protein [Candidatus Berkelbacteria bacterium]|nr:phosphatase PAP2 family protein [Candidatus Berkelbacteria bacterium]
MVDALLAADARVFLFLHQWAAFLPAVWKWVALVGVYCFPVVLIWYWLTRRRETALFAFAAGVFAWQGLNNLASAFSLRERPLALIDLHFPDREFLFDRPGSSFPSDHTAFMAAIAIAFWRAGERSVAIFLGIITVLTALARVVTAQHWPGDILIGAVIGLLSVVLLSAVRRPLDTWVISPLVQLARKIGL